MNNSAGQTFYASFWRIWAGLIGPTFAVLVPFFLLAGAFGADLPFALLLLTAAALVQALFALPLAYGFKTVVGPTGINGVGFWGQRVFLAWSEMREPERKNLFGLPYAVIQSDKNGKKAKGEIWLPLFLNRRARFEAAVEAFAPSGHTLARLVTKETPNRSRV